MSSIAVGDWDGQPDLFQFSFGDYSGKFVFGANSVIQMIPKQDLRITYTTCTGTGCPGYATTGSIISFTITTPDGNQYLFGTLTAIESSKTTNSTVSGGNCIPREYPNQTITAWYLKSVTNPRSGDVITLSYTDYTVSYDISYNESYKYAYSDNSTSAGGCPAVVPGTHAKCLTQKTDYGKLLSSIVSPLGKIEFTPEAIRSDVTVSAGNYRIKEAKIYGKNNVLLRSFQFTQTFIQSSGTTPSPAAASKYRMYLDGITELDALNVQVNNWVFDYHNRTSLPPRFSYQQDHWGYFNNRNNTQLTPAPTFFGTKYVDLLSNNFNPANRTPDGTVSYYGNLKKVTYPTGGSVDYEYEGNEVAVCANENVPTPATSSLALTYAGTPLTQTVDFTINYTQPVKITYDVQQNGVHLAGAYARLKQISPSASTLQTWGAQLASPVLLQGTKYFILSAGTYRLEASVQQGALGAGYNAPFSNQPEHANITATWDYTSATYSSMVFRYQFDARGRLTTKTLPSAGSTTIAYDRLDRPVLVTDAKGFKNYTRYDILNRVVASGKYKGTAVPGTTEPLFETANTTAPHFYTTTTFPTDNNVDVYQVMYYDDYDLDNNGSVAASEAYTNPAETPFDATAFLRTRGKMTAVKSGILSNSGAAPATYLTARTYYDKEYSAIQVNKQNHLGGADIVSSAFDFANRLIKTRRDHTATPPGGTLKTHVIREEYVYDHASRLLYTVHQIGAQQKVVLAANKYDELGRMKEKNLHASNYTGTALPTTSSTYNYLQSLDYTYNIRGWLTGINDPTPSTCATQSGDNLADMFNMKLSYESLTSGGTAQYNGNISVMEWRTNVGGVCGERQLYNFSYDGANRLTAADHRSWNGTAWTNPNKYNESGITYDLNGNIKTYTRQGATTSPTTFGTIDNLTYTYGDALRPDRLTQVADLGSITKGFKYVAAAAAYTYDLNGNMTRDNHKTVSIAYNHLNLPNSFAFDSGSEITIVYSADGIKLSKTTGSITKNYISGIEYSGINLEAIYHAEGRCTPNGASFNYDYTIKDHLGNTRVNFRANGTTTTHLEALHYYPFGMLMEGLGTTSPLNDYAYNGKELNEDFGLNLSDYGARWYDAALGRWWSVDPMANKYNRWSSYCYTFDNPLRYIDPNGMEVTESSGKITITGEDVQVFLKQLNASLDSGDPEKGKTTTEIKQTFKYDKTDKGAKLKDGTDKLVKSVISTSRGLQGEIRTTVVTTLTVDSKGVISPNAEMRAWTETGTGDNFSRSAEATATVLLANVEEDLKNAAISVSEYKRDKGESELQTTASNLSTAIDITAGVIAGRWIAPALKLGPWRSEALGAGVGLLSPDSVSPTILYKTHKYLEEKHK